MSLLRRTIALSLSPARRFWLAALALALVVVFVAALQFVATARHYTATQELHVAVLAAAGVPDGDGAADAERMARSISSQSTLNSPALADALLARISATQHTQLSLSRAQVAAALSATHRETTIQLSATWTSPAGANALLAAAIAALQSDPTLTSGSTLATETVRLQTDGAAAPAERAPGEESAAMTLFLTRIALGLIASALLPYALTLILPPPTAPAVPISSTASAAGD